jgi:phosphatidylglycerol:prolipoprotein diacylglycerol transferase
MLAISFIVGILFAAKRAKKYDIESDRVLDLAMIIIVSSIVGSRLLYVLFHLEEFRGNWLDTFNPFQSSGQIGIAGLTVLGGVVLSIFSSLLYLKIKKLSFLRFADVLIPSVALGIFFTRIGCYLAGCCYGQPTDLPWGVSFPSGSAAHFHYGDVHIHPTQLYSSFYGLAILGILLFAERTRRFDGQLFYLFLALYGISRFSVDMVRYYETSMQIGIGGLSLSVNQTISVLMILSGAILFIYNLRRSNADKGS